MISLEHWPKLKQLREKLNGKAKAEPGFRFYLLHDKVFRKDFLKAAYAQVKANKGASGVDGKTFEDIEAYGVERFLTELADELKELRYEPQPVHLGIQGELYAQVLDGVRDGDKVVTFGSFFIDSEYKLKGTAQGGP